MQDKKRQDEKIKMKKCPNENPRKKNKYGVSTVDENSLDGKMSLKRLKRKQKIKIVLKKRGIAAP